MSWTDSNRFSTDPDRQIDMLVDGELSEPDRRALLARLDQQPDGWRRCALAFLEAQCWREALGPVASSHGADEAAASVPVGEEARSVPRRSSPWLRSAGTLLAMAASFVAALGLGIWARPLWRPHGDEPSTALVRVPEAGGSDATGRPSPWRMVTLSVPNGDQRTSQSIRLPAMERDRLDESWLNSLPGPLSSDVLQMLRQTGHQVEHSRELLPVPLQDGRKLVIPIDQIEVRPVGNRAYQ